jgi:hypothetical protein
MNNIDSIISLVVQSLPSNFDFIFRFFFYSTSPIVIFLICGFILYGIDYKYGIRIIFLFILNILLNTILLTSLRIPIPTKLNPNIKFLLNNDLLNSFSTPPLNTQTTMSLLYYQYSDIKYIFYILLTIVLISMSNINLGVSIFSANIFSIIIGILISAIYKKNVISTILSFLKPFKETQQILLIISITFITTLCFLSNVLIFGDFSNNSFNENYINFYPAMYSSGLFLGISIGSLLFINRFTIQNNLYSQKRIHRLAILLIFTLFLIIPFHITVFSFSKVSFNSIFQFVSLFYITVIIYASFGYILTYLVPIFFHKIKLLKLSFNYMN